ncbi:hypothetical protein BDF21DRAFT_466072 [Thamnidium elegans]|uniref:Uncharacterized protein n=1 Tax=Thamnidium elegans TaxID=101142 RepID=A0A8H7VZB8_9FUNG|nr:hypothetical protein INT48_001967 [Thamnidium elegans]KAI8067319.1 hypothetical protein BDF21DRAFT_466072 [Thamnidium elegans]
MDFSVSLTEYLLTTHNPTMKDVFDRAILYAYYHDPGFVKSYKWPVKTSEPSEKQSTDSDLIRSYEQAPPNPSSTSAFFPTDRESTDYVCVATYAFEALNLSYEEADDNNDGDYDNYDDGYNICNDSDDYEEHPNYEAYDRCNDYNNRSYQPNYDENAYEYYSHDLDYDGWDDFYGCHDEDDYDYDLDYGSDDDFY